MDEGINNILTDDLNEAHGMFETIITEMKEHDVVYKYDEIINMESMSYRNANNAIKKMWEAQRDYNLLCDTNKEYFSGKRRIIIKYLMLYLVSIIMIKVFAKTLSAQKLNEMWYALLGMTLGSVNMGIINKNINEYRNQNKNNRELYCNLEELKKTYDDNFDIARKEVNYIFSLNRNLQDEIPKEKIFTKK